MKLLISLEILSLSVTSLPNKPNKTNKTNCFSEQLSNYKTKIFLNFLI